MSAIITGREPHPVFSTLEPELEEQWRKIDAKKIEEYYAIRREAMMLESLDPYRNGYEPEIWKKADEQLAALRERNPVGVIEELDLGGNRAAKSERAAKRLVQLMVNKPGARVWFLQSTQTISRQSQQSIVWKYLPPEWKPQSGRTKREITTKINYTQAGGFTEDTFVLPNGSQGFFKFYSVAVSSVEGPELDAAWCFVAGTSIQCPRGSVAIEELNPGDLVTTRAGAGKVIANSVRVRPVGRVKFSNGQELVGTSDHPVLTLSHGWTRLSELQKGDCVCAIDVSSGVEKRIIPIAGVITSALRERQALQLLADTISIAKFSRLATDLFQKAVRFITRTVTFLTMLPTTLNVSLRLSTCPSIFGAGVDYLPPTGEINPCTPRHAWTADESNLGKLRNPLCANFASTEGRKNGEETSANVPTAKRDSGAGGETFAVSVASTWVPDGEAEVFNLKVAGAPEYFANGILVHNCDELVTEDWLEFLRYRLITRNGYLLTTFTPVEGYSSTVKSYLDQAKTIEEGDAELLPIRNAANEITGYEKVPRVQHAANGKTVILYFHTSDNPYGNYPSMKETLRGKPRETILMRAYGVPSKTFGAALPMFRRSVHVITTEQWMGMLNKFQGSRYHLVDPCSGRNWFMIWCYCMAGKIIVYREWPSHGHLGAYIPGMGDPGPWTISGKAFDGERGPAQTSFGFGLERYKQEILRLENGEEISERYMDARTANSPTTTRDGSTTLIEQMDELDMDFRGAAAEKSIFGSENGSIDMLNSKLYFDLETPLGTFSPQLARINGPELLVTDNCPNLIYSLENWTGKDGQHGACKDPIDVARMIVLNELEYVSDDMLKPIQPWMKQFAA